MLRRHKVRFEDEQKTFTQAEIDAMVKATKDESQKALSAITAELEAVKKRSDLTAKERAELESRVEEVNKKLLTSEELAAREREKLKKEAESQVANLSAEAEAWKSRFIETTIVRSLADAASDAGAYRTNQVVALLKPNAKLTEVRDADGNVAGFDVVVKFKDKDTKGQTVEMELAPTAVVKRMTELEDFQNLFQTRGSGGTGRNLSGHSGKQPTLADAAKLGAEAYRAQRAKGGL